MVEEEVVDSRKALNTWKKAAIGCWIVGGIMIAIGASYVFGAFETKAGPTVLWVLGIGVVIMATGGTLNQIGTGRL